MKLMSHDAEIAAQYAEIVYDKITTLIKYAVWDTVNLERFNRWKKQFVDEQESYLAAYLAFQLLYYNKKDFLTLISWAFAETIRQVVLNQNPNLEFNDNIWLQKLQEEEHNILICPFAVDTPAASGNMVTRLLRNQDLISETRLCSVNQIKEKLDTNRYKAIVFVDDIIGSGDQAREFVFSMQNIGDERISISNLLARYEIQKFLAVGLAPLDSVECVQRQTGFTVIAAETLTEKNSTIESSFWFPEDEDEAKAFLRRLSDEKNVPRLGHKDGAWAVAFEHGMPDVSCPFYYHENENWFSLFPRRGVAL